MIWGTASATAAEATASYTSIMSAFFKGQTLLYSPTTVAALLWYRSIAQAVLDKYAAQGYTGPRIATQLARLQQIAEQLKAWGVE